MKTQKYAPIVVTVYNRIHTFKKCIESLQQNDYAVESDLYVVSDAAYKTEDIQSVIEIREYAKTIKGFREVYLLLREHNMGAHTSGYDGIIQALKENDSFIFLEDDIVVSPDFLSYLNNALVYYKSDERIFSISAFCLPFEFPTNYNKDIWFFPSSSPWGYATWKDRWEKVDYSYRNRYAELKQDRKKYKEFLSVGFYIKGILLADSRGEITAGDLRVYYHMFLRNMISVFPVVTKSQNWGFDGSGEHCNNKKAWWAKPNFDESTKVVKFESFDGFDEQILKKQRDFQDKINGGIVARYLKYTWIHDLYKKIKMKIIFIHLFI